MREYNAPSGPSDSEGPLGIYCGRRGSLSCPPGPKGLKAEGALWASRFAIKRKPKGLRAASLSESQRGCCPLWGLPQYITSLSVVGFGPATQERTEGERSKTPLWGRGSKAALWARAFRQRSASGVRYILRPACGSKAARRGAKRPGAFRQRCGRSFQTEMRPEALWLSPLRGPLCFRQSRRI